MGTVDASAGVAIKTQPASQAAVASGSATLNVVAIGWRGFVVIGMCSGFIAQKDQKIASIG